MSTYNATLWPPLAYPVPVSTYTKVGAVLNNFQINQSPIALYFIPASAYTGIGARFRDNQPRPPQLYPQQAPVNQQWAATPAAPNPTLYGSVVATQIAVVNAFGIVDARLTPNSSAYPNNANASNITQTAPPVD